jgi:predicted phosphodiesterase
MKGFLESVPAGAVIGIMADSHGRPDVIRKAIEYFDALGCARIYHLGDICDSTLPETAADCVRPLQRADITPLLGNNDRSSLTAIGAQETDAAVVRFLRQLPLTARCGCAVFAHSLPFVETLGPACLIGPMDDRAAGRFFKAFPGAVLFRGHSHNPEIASPAAGRIDRRALEVGRRVFLERKRSCIVTCGALTRRLCVLWYPNAHAIELIRF